jgi:NAD(P)-dependent dehydrogenase (short-subunit alcohol dehydrogenase family)
MSEPGVALVTGGARRIGRDLVRALAERGWAVAIHYRVSKDEAETLTAEIEARGGRALPVQADLADPAQAERILVEASGVLGPLSVLVNNAAIFEYDHAREFSVTDWDRQLAINLRAPVVLARDFARMLAPDRTGLIVNLLDQGIAWRPKGFFSYTISKTALATATELLALELAPRVRVNGIAPGLTLISGKQSAADFERLVDRTPLGKGSSPAAIRRAFEYLLDADAVTGQILFVDGGRRLTGRAPADPT